MRKLCLQLTCILLLATATVVWGQAVGGTLSGKITSASGAPVPNAAVTVTNVDTNATQKVLTGSDGSFAVPGLSPGTYRVDVETAGYKRTSQQNIELTTSGPSTVNITLEAGNANETVEIKGTSPVTQDYNGEVGIGLGTRVVRELPVIDRNHQELTGLETGITPPTPALDAAIDPERNRFYSTNGQSPFLNRYYLEGVINQEPYRGSAVRVVPEEAIQQMNISTANLTMEKGFTAGGFITDNTRGGTNGWHGSLFEFWSGNPLRTRSFFDTVDNNAPRFTMNQFGGAMGGALVPDRTFFFGSYEGMYQRGDNTTISTVPVPSALTGNFGAIPGLTLYSPLSGSLTGTGRTAFNGNIIPSNLINTQSAAIAALIPAPNQPGFVNNYIANAPFQNDYQRFDGRIDQHFSDRTSAFLRYGFSNDHNVLPSALGDVIGAGTHTRLIGQNAVLDVTHAFGSRLITDFKMGYNRYDEHVGSSSNLIGINIPGMLPIGTPAYVPEHPVDNTFNWVWSWGLHTSTQNVKFGVDIRRYRSDGFLDSMLGTQFGAGGTAYFGPGATLLNNGAALSQYGEFYNAFAAFLLGAPSQVGSAGYLTTPTVRQTESGLWLGDTIQVLRKVTLDLGVRYEVFSPLEPRNPGGAGVFNTAANAFDFLGLGNNGMHRYMYDLDNIAPRIGLAFHASDKTVIRGGYGMQYFQYPYMLSGFLSPTLGSVSGVQGGYTTAGVPFNTALNTNLTSTGTAANGSPAGNLPAAVVPHRIETPYIQTFSLQLQRDFYYGTMLSLGYVGTLGRHLPGWSELNAGLPGTGIAGLPFASLGRTGSTLGYENGLTSNYNSLQVSLSKRFSQGLSFQGAYTYAKALGYTTANNMILNPFNLRSNYGPTDYDRQHVLTIAHLWELPLGRRGSNFASTILGGWQLNGVLTWQTGTPLTLTADPLLCGCVNTTVLAGANGSVGTTGNFGNGQSFFSGSFFAPAGSNIANLGRNSLRGPDSWNYNLSLFKNFRVAEKFNLQLRGEAYNLTNTTHPVNPVTNINSPAFGQITGAVLGGFGRQVNLAARVEF